MNKEERNLIKKKLKDTGFEIGDVIKDKKTGQYWQINDLDWAEISPSNIVFCLTQKIKRDCPEDLEELENIRFTTKSYKEIEFVYRP